MSVADGDALAPAGWQYPGQWWGLDNPYAGLDQNDPLFQYGDWFDPQAQQGWGAWADNVLLGPEAGPYAQLAGIPANFDPNLQGTVEQPAMASPWGADPLFNGWSPNMLQSQLTAQSTGLAPPGGAQSGEMPTNAPWIGAQQPGELPSEAGFGDIGGL